MKVVRIRPAIVIDYTNDEGQERTAVHFNARTVLSEFGLSNPKLWTPEEMSAIVNDYDTSAHQLRIDVLECKMEYGIAYGEILMRQRREAEILKKVEEAGKCEHIDYFVDGRVRRCFICQEEVLDKEFL